MTFFIFFLSHTTTAISNKTCVTVTTLTFHHVCVTTFEWRTKVNVSCCFMVCLGMIAGHLNRHCLTVNTFTCTLHNRSIALTMITVCSIRPYSRFQWREYNTRHLQIILVPNSSCADHRFFGLHFVNSTYTMQST